MEKRYLLVFLVIAILSGSCGQPPYTKVADGIVVSPQQPQGGVKQVKVQVIAADIFKVTAAAADTFARAESLMAISQPAYSSFTIKEEKDRAILSTKSLKAEVLYATGEVIFKDSTGNIILEEQKGGGKSFTALKAGGQGHEIRQVFESPDDEALYGLGAHQNGQMNYKGQDVELAQHNIIDVVPFVYSSRNYGVLWDNYSISRFGDPREYRPLSSLQLFDRDGKPGGLTADYYIGDKIIRTAAEDRINYEFLETPEVDNFPKDVANKGKVVWEGSFTSDIKGDHKFVVYASGYFKVWVDGKLIMDKWRQNWNPWTNKFNVTIAGGERHNLKIEWICEGGFMAVKHLDPLPVKEQSQLSLSSEIGDEIAYYVIRGNNADGVISGYRTLTGKAPVMPIWAMGFWQSRERYRSQQEVLDVVKEYRKRNIPLDNIVLDWQYWEAPKWGSHEFDHSRFPDPEGMVKTLHDQLHANIMISVWPKFNKGTSHYEEMNKKGFLFTRNIEKGRKDWVGVGYESTFYDPFNPEAGKLFWKQIESKLDRIGMDAWWLDATEPDMHSNLSIEERKLNMSPTAIGSGAKYFNAYSLMNAKSVYEGQRKSDPDKRVFILTRSAYGGQQRYSAATWSGDIVTRWSDMQDQISAGLNFSLSGIPYWGMDIGGFSVESRYEDAKGAVLDEWREINARWFQFGAFCPLFRSHGQYPYREIYNIAPEGHEVYESMVYYSKLRYRLMPYVYSMAGHAFLDDYTLMRGLIMDFPDDKNVRNIADQYMFGPSLLVNPVCEYKARSRHVYLPAGAGWYDLYTGKYEKGDRHVQADAPLNRMPVFVREGSIVPVGPEIQYTQQKPADPLTLFVYTGRDAHFDLYEDEGVNYNYEKGVYSIIPMQYNEASHTLTIGKRNGTYSTMLAQRKIEVVWVTPEKPQGFTPDVRVAQVLDYNGEEVSIPMK